jgi:hypothetical protein
MRGCGEGTVPAVTEPPHKRHIAIIAETYKSRSESTFRAMRNENRQEMVR